MSDRAIIQALIGFLTSFRPGDREAVYQLLRHGLGDNLITAISENETLRAEFLNRFHGTSAGGARLDASSVAAWLARRCFHTDPVQAVAELFEYVASDTADFHFVAVLHGPWLNGGIVPVTDGFRLCSINDVEPLHFRQTLQNARNTGVPGPEATAVLDLPVTLTKYVGEMNPRDEAGNFFEWLGGVNLNVQTIRLALGASEAGGVPCQVIATGFVSADHLPSAASQGWSQYSFTPGALDKPLDEEHFRKTIKIIGAIRALPEDAQISVRRSLHWFNVACSTLDFSLRATALRVGLEAILLSDDINNELVFRVSLRGAFLLSPPDSANRPARREQVKALYTACSSVVHGGDASKLSRQKRDAINAGCNLLHELITARLEHQEIDWKTVEIDGGRALHA